MKLEGMTFAAATALIQELLLLERPLRGALEKRLDELGLSLQDLETLETRLTTTFRAFKETGQDNLSDLSLPNEACLFFTWLMADFATTSDSEQFSSRVNLRALSMAPKNEVNLGAYRVTVVGWVVGRPIVLWSNLYPAVLPNFSRNLNSESVLAFDGLLSHAEELGKLRDLFGEASLGEISKSAVVVRLCGLVESIHKPKGDSNVDQTLTASLYSILRECGQSIPESKRAKWMKDVDLFVEARNAVAHVWKRNADKRSLSEIVDTFEIGFLLELFEISTYLVAGEISRDMRNENARSAIRWLETIERDIETQEQSLAWFPTLTNS